MRTSKILDQDMRQNDYHNDINIRNNQMGHYYKFEEYGDN